MMVRKNLVVENGRIIFRNFAGEATKYKRAGSREFSVVFDYETGMELLDQGWNIKTLRPREEGDIPDCHLSVAVQFGAYPPEVYMVRGKKKVLLDEDSISILDQSEIEYCDIVIRPYNWEVNGKAGVKAYVKTMYAVLKEDMFAGKYDFDIEDEEIPF